MRTYLYGTMLMALLTSCVVTEEVRMGSREFGHVLRDGAKAKFTLRVVDDDGAIVEGAQVKMSFAMETSKWITGSSDDAGLFSASGKSRGEMLYRVMKDGYYLTAGRVEFGRHDGVVVKNGKWQPWNETKVLIVKKEEKKLGDHEDHDHEHDAP